MGSSPHIQAQPVYLGLGSNLGTRRAHLTKALDLLQAGGFKVSQVSAVYETPPWGLEDQPAFLNQVVEGEFSDDPFALLNLAMQVEAECGRERLVHWGPRVLDIDILAIGAVVINSQRLTIPHPYLSRRAFVLVPWAEIAPSYQPPGYELTIAQLVDQLPVEDQMNISVCKDAEAT